MKKISQQQIEQVMQEFYNLDVGVKKYATISQFFKDLSDLPEEKLGPVAMPKKPSIKKVKKVKKSPEKMV